MKKILLLLALFFPVIGVDTQQQEQDPVLSQQLMEFCTLMVRACCICIFGCTKYRPAYRLQPQPEFVTPETQLGRFAHRGTFQKIGE